jgi:hypothetical protein
VISRASAVGALLDDGALLEEGALLGVAAVWVAGAELGAAGLAACDAGGADGLCGWALDPHPVRRGRVATVATVAKIEIRMFMVGEAPWKACPGNSSHAMS